MGIKNYKNFSSRSSRESDSLNSKSKPMQQPIASLTFTSKIPNLEDQFKIQIPKLEDPYAQDLYEWIKSIKDAATICEWKDEQGIMILKILVNQQFHYIFEQRKSFMTCLEAIKEKLGKIPTPEQHL